MKSRFSLAPLTWIKPRAHLESQDITFVRITPTTSVKRSVLAMSMRFTYDSDCSPLMQSGQTDK
jgi:hypothetical protein